MNGWILKTLHPNVYGNHNWKYSCINRFRAYKMQVYRERVYKCLKCNQELRMSCSWPRLINAEDPKIQDCNEAQMVEALE